MSGREDQAGGLAWRLKDGNNYYIARQGGGCDFRGSRCANEEVAATFEKAITDVIAALQGNESPV